MVDVIKLSSDDEQDTDAPAPKRVRTSSSFRIPKKSSHPVAQPRETISAPVALRGIVVAFTTATINGVRGKCIAVYDEERRRLFRLCSPSGTASPFWEASAVDGLGMLVPVTYSPCDGPPTSLPHSMDDRYATSLRRDKSHTGISIDQLSRLIAPFARSELAAVWPAPYLSPSTRPCVASGSPVPSLAWVRGAVTAFDKEGTGLAQLELACGTALPNIKVNDNAQRDSLVAGRGLNEPALLLLGLARAKPPSITCLILLVGKLPLPGAAKPKLTAKQPSSKQPSRLSLAPGVAAAARTAKVSGADKQAARAALAASRRVPPVPHSQGDLLAMLAQRQADQARTKSTIVQKQAAQARTESTAQAHTGSTARARTMSTGAEHVPRASGSGCGGAAAAAMTCARTSAVKSQDCEEAAAAMTCAGTSMATLASARLAVGARVIIGVGRARRVAARPELNGRCGEVRGWS